MAKGSLYRTQLFFDRKAVINAVGRANAQALGKAGAFVRRGARSSLRKRKRSSAAGMPPSVHSPEPNLRSIEFAFDKKAGVVVGTIDLPRGSDAPEMAEHGGTTTITRTRYRGGKKVRVKQRARYAARPYMVPALNREMPKFPSLWSNSVR